MDDLQTPAQPDPHAAWRRSIDERFAAGSQRMDALQGGINQVAATVEGMADELAKNTEITTEVRDLMTTIKGGFRIVGWLGIAAKWVARVATAAGTLWGVMYLFFHNGQPPK